MTEKNKKLASKVKVANLRLTIMKSHFRKVAFFEENPAFGKNLVTSLVKTPFSVSSAVQAYW